MAAPKFVFGASSLTYASSIGFSTTGSPPSGGGGAVRGGAGVGVRGGDGVDVGVGVGVDVGVGLIVGVGAIDWITSSTRSPVASWELKWYGSVSAVSIASDINEPALLATAEVVP